VDLPNVDISDRWRLYRRARERGEPESVAYDRYLHPRTRLAEADLAEELAAAEAASH
jgi:hypothetical protein